MTIVGVVPARGGSKSIPHKNIALLGDRTLLAYTADAAASATLLDRTILSTDSAEIADVGRSLGLEVPYQRPAGLAEDTTPILPVLLQLLDWLEQGGTAVEAFVLLQPTSPFRNAEDIDGAVRLLRSRDADSVVTVVPVPHQFNPVSVMKMEDGRLTSFLPGPPVLRRQDKPEVFARNGPAVLVLRPRILRRGILYSEATYGYEMPAERSVDIDGPDDLALAERMLSVRH
ncbi:acylneuraminate cytidylyltransferase family protein [Devosia sp.]|jgi:CMP-N,N'-diacetyllegionaminic acid synthase|uniref:acylneuraminate cytidylyltransferase family protein n=1 Tax=Devosia sp. TaxID=1871048 RepID=UPI0037C02FA9